MDNEKELEKRQETIDKLNKKIKLFEDYVSFYENTLPKRGDH